MATQHADVKRLRAPFDGFVVDGFNFTKTFPGCRHWLLTHAHSDHTCGLSGGFDAGTIYCSEITKRLVMRDVSARLGERMVVINAGESIHIEELATTLTALDAGHCPGALMFLFEAEGHRALHTGDCRASPDVVAAAVAAVCGPPARGGLDILYLDTTYASPRWDFPPQPESLSMMQRIVEAELAREPRTLFIVGSYSVIFDSPHPLLSPAPSPAPSPSPGAQGPRAHLYPGPPTLTLIRWARRRPSRLSCARRAAALSSLRGAPPACACATCGTTHYTRRRTRPTCARWLGLGLGLGLG